MRPLAAGGIALGGLALAGGALALALRPRRVRSAPLNASPDSLASSQLRLVPDDPIVAPAYPYLDHWSPEERRALLDLQRELGLDPVRGGLAGVIGHESGGDPAAPHQQSGTPRGGLIQVTVGAHLPGYESADAVWSIRDQDRLRQLRGIVRDYYRRQIPHGPPGDQSAASLLRRNYLPALADLPAAHVLGVRAGGAGPRGERPEDQLAPGLTRGANYAANPRFDPAGRGWFTWEDVDGQSRSAERAALARGWVRVSGAHATPGDLPVAGAAEDEEPIEAVFDVSAPIAVDVAVVGIGAGRQRFRVGEYVTYGWTENKISHGTLLGIVISAGPKMLTVRWQSGIRNRLQQGDERIRPMTDPEFLDDARRTLANLADPPVSGALTKLVADRVSAAVGGAAASQNDSEAALW